MIRLSLFACSLFALAGCAGDAAQYPSIMKRPIESRSDALPAEAVAVAAADPALDAQLAVQRTALTKAHGDFTMAAMSADRLTRAATAAAPGTDAWLDAQTALGALDDAHGSTQAVTSALEALAIDRAGKLLPPYPALEQLRQGATAQSDAETSTSAELQARLKPAG